MPRNANACSMIADQRLDDWHQGGNLVSASGSELDRYPACRRAAARQGLVVPDAVCMERYLGAAQQHLGFRNTDAPHRCTLRGFSVQEVEGMWTMAPEASLSCARPKGAQRLVIEHEAYLVNGRQQVRFSIAGEVPVTVNYDAKRPRQTVVLALPKDEHAPLTVKIEALQAASPLALGLAQDGRLLGIQLRQAEFQ